MPTSRPAVNSQPADSSPVPIPETPRLPWFHYAAISFGCCLLLSVPRLDVLCGCCLLAALGLCGYGFLDKYVTSRGRPAIAHPRLRWLAIALVSAGPLYIFIFLLPASQKAAREAGDKAGRKQAAGSGTESPDGGSKAEDAFHQGEIAYQKQDYDLAIGCFTESIRLRPDHAQGYGSRACAYWAKGNAERSIADLTEAIRLKPDYAEAYYCRGVAYANGAAPSKAIADFTEAIRLEPHYADAYCNRGTAYLNNGDIEKAAGDLTEAIRLNPNDAVAHFNRGNAYKRKGDQDKAAADYADATRLGYVGNTGSMPAQVTSERPTGPAVAAANKQDADAYFNRGVTDWSNGDSDKAIAEFTAAIRLNPQYFEAYCNRGRAFEAKGNDDKAIADYTDAIRINPNYAAAYRFRGMAYVKKGETSKAEEDFAIIKSLADSPFEPVSPGSSVASESKTPSIRTIPNRDSATYCDLGDEYRRKDDFDRAIAAYTAAIQLDPNFADAYYNRGVVYSRKGDKREAEADFAHARRLRGG